MLRAFLRRQGERVLHKNIMEGNYGKAGGAVVVVGDFNNCAVINYLGTTSFLDGAVVPWASNGAVTVCFVSPTTISQI